MRWDMPTMKRILTSHRSCEFPWKNIWKVKVPFKVAFFCWVVSLGKVLTTENLRRRGMYIANCCVMCKKDGESVNHLSLHCEAIYLWKEVLNRTGFLWVMPKEVVDLLVGWKGLKGSKNAVHVWKIIPSCLMCCLWLERNGRCF
ncbi:uncharacterized protein LOC122314694 [Carya illinoinensis]|uniref:uncharacterized protein LOC122314694 n=1 Tax=Carya illinoinensis TaxID=32201 RepID=UPI001C719866|nr:uncharacterized protein LOC122314694 [Carya illinoinensis]